MNDEAQKATITALRATVNALMRELRDRDPQGLQRVIEHAVEEARNLTIDGSREQVEAVNAIGLQLGGNR